jgi:cobalt-zinc-cadmium efflux system membrane fusion protein
MRKYFTLVMVLLLGACQGKVGDVSEDIAISQGSRLILGDDQINLAGIESGRIEEKVLSDVLNCNGYVRVPPRGQVTVSLPVEAYVRDIRFHWGEKVAEGDLLAIMEHPDFLRLQQDYIETGNNLALLKEDLERQEALARENAASMKSLMRARTSYENTLAQYASLKEQLRLLGLDPSAINVNSLQSRVNIRAPISGYISHHEIKIGELMHAGDPIVELVDITSLNLHLVVYSKDISRVQGGQQVEFTTEARDRVYHGVVHAKGKAIDPGTRSVDVHARITDPDINLLSGMYVKAQILIGRSKVYAIPETGVVTEDGQSYIFINEERAFNKTAINTGMRKDGFVEILSPGDLLGKEVVLTGAYYLNAEMMDTSE